MSDSSGTPPNLSASRRLRIGLTCLTAAAIVGLFGIPVLKRLAAAREERDMREKLYQRFLVEMNKDGFVNTNEPGFDKIMRRTFDELVVHPSFGLTWDEVPAPTLTGTRALKSVQAFVAANGWNMETNAWSVVDGSTGLKPIRGLPWAAIEDREFPAVTHNGVLYVMLKGWHHNLSGVAYNPNTNQFAPGMRGFLPVGDHWYAWAEPEDPITLTQKYEGKAQ